MIPKSRCALSQWNYGPSFGTGLADIVLRDFTYAMSVVFLTASAIIVIAFVLSLFLKQVQLRSAGDPGRGKSPAVVEELAPAVH